MSNCLRWFATVVQFSTNVSASKTWFKQLSSSVVQNIWRRHCAKISPRIFRGVLLTALRTVALLVRANSYQFCSPKPQRRILLRNDLIVYPERNHRLSDHLLYPNQNNKSDQSERVLVKFHQSEASLSARCIIYWTEGAKSFKHSCKQLAAMWARNLPAKICLKRKQNRLAIVILISLTNCKERTSRTYCALICILNVALGESYF